MLREKMEMNRKERRKQYIENIFHNIRQSWLGNGIPVSSSSDKQQKELNEDLTFLLSVGQGLQNETVTGDVIYEYAFTIIQKYLPFESKSQCPKYYLISSLEHLAAKIYFFLLKNQIVVKTLSINCKQEVDRVVWIFNGLGCNLNLFQHLTMFLKNSHAGQFSQQSLHYIFSIQTLHNAEELYEEEYNSFIQIIIAQLSCQQLLVLISNGFMGHCIQQEKQNLCRIIFQRLSQSEDEEVKEALFEYRYAFESQMEILDKYWEGGEQ